MQRLQGCTTASGSKSGSPRRLSSAQNSPSTTPVKSARRISSRGEHRQSPRSTPAPTADENGFERKPFSKPTPIAIRALDRDIFGPLQVNGVGRQHGQTEEPREPKDNNIAVTSDANSCVNDKPAENELEAASPSSPSRFGTPAACPGCHSAVSPMERGVVPGPHGTRWHAGCLVCGGKGTDPKEDTQLGCGKKLDSSAKTDKACRLFCRNCLVSKSTPYI